MYKTRLVIKPTSDTTAEEARDARVTALRFAIDKYLEKQKVTHRDGGEDDASDEFTYEERSRA